jgi:hypothetical protein
MTQGHIIIAHDFGKDGLTFVCTEFGTAREFETVEEAQAMVDALAFAQGKPGQVWSICVVAEIVPAKVFA